MIEPVIVLGHLLDTNDAEKIVVEKDTVTVNDSIECFFLNKGHIAIIKTLDDWLTNEIIVYENPIVLGRLVSDTVKTILWARKRKRDIEKIIDTLRNHMFRVIVRPHEDGVEITGVYERTLIEGVSDVLELFLGRGEKIIEYEVRERTGKGYLMRYERLGRILLIEIKLFTNSEWRPGDTEMILNNILVL